MGLSFLSRSACVALCAVVLSWPLFASGQVLVTTTGTVAGINQYPLGTPLYRERYQQVYDSTLFAAFPEGIVITSAAFQTTAVDARTFRSLDLTLKASEALVGPGTITADYDGNVGAAPQTTVFDDTFTFTTAGDGTFDVVIPFSTPFLLRPGSNLLLDFDVDSPSEFGVGFVFLAPSDTTGRTFNLGGSGAATAGPNQGLHTQFSVTPVPGPGALVITLMGAAPGVCMLARRQRRR